jgi:hypothetical protein
VRSAVLFACAAFVLTTGAATAGGQPKLGPAGSGLVVTASPAFAGARHVRLTVSLHYEMQCGYSGAGPLTVTLPASISLPGTLPAGAVLVGGKATAATLAGTRVTVQIAPHAGVMCDVIGPGVLQLVFTPQAGLGNPAHSGSYRVAAVHGRHSFSTELTITPRS